MNKFKLFLSVMAVLLLGSTAIMAQESKGYALFGAVPEGYEDLTGKVEVSTDATMNGQDLKSGTYATPDQSTPLQFTGTGLSTSHSVQHYAALSIRFKEPQSMILTNEMVIHIHMKRADASTEGLMRLSMTKNKWGDCRLSFQIAKEDLTTTSAEYEFLYTAPSGINSIAWNQDKLINGEAYPAGDGTELFRFEAALGEKFEITQIYIEKTYTPEPAPTNVTAIATATDWDKVTLNLKADCEESTIVTYEVTYGSITKTFTANAGEATTYLIDGLQGSTTYNFSVVAKNEDDVAASAVETTATTPAKPIDMEVRYYFYRTGDLPANSGTLTNRDLRDGKDGIFQKNSGGGNPDFEVLTDTKFAKYQLSYNWCYMRIMATEETMSDINGEWYLHLRYKTTHKKPLYANVAGHDKSMMKIADKDRACDNLWHDTVIALTDYVSKMTIPVAMNSDVFQIQNANSNNDNPGTFAIDYAYISNTNQQLDLGYQDVTAPVMTVNQTDLTGTSVSFNIAGIDDSDSKIYYTISDGTNNYEFTYNSKEAFDYQLTGLEKGTDYTIIITAKDPFGNQSTWSQTITTVGDATAPEMVSVNQGEVLDNSIELLLKANDDQEGTLTYTISVGGNTYTTTGLAGEEVSYKVSGLTPETEYEFSVVAADAGENTSAPIVVKYSTIAFVAYRYYIVGEGTDATLHKSVDCTITYGNQALQDTRVSDYYSIKTGNHDWTQINFKSKTTVVNTIDVTPTNNWHLVMRFRSSIDNWIFFDKNFRVNLMNDASNYYLRTSDFGGVETLGDGQWHTVKFKLSDAAGTVPTQFLQADQIAVQLYVPGNSNYLQKDEFFDIDYLYFTNDPAEDPSPRTDRKILLHDNRINNDNYATLLEKNNGNTVDVDLNRSFVADGAWYTLCLPFSMTADQVNAAFGACKLAKLNGSELRGSSLIHLNFDYVNTIEAGVPYLFMPMANVNPVIIEDVVIDNTLRPIETTYFSMKGIFYPTHVATGDYFLGTDNYLIAVKDGDSSNLKGLRAYFTIGAGAPASAQARVVMAPTVTTDLPENTITNTAEKVIKDGTIYILRGDKIYTTTGQLVK